MADLLAGPGSGVLGYSPLAWSVAHHTSTDAVLAGAPARIMVNTMLLGALYGVGGTAVGVAIRYVGFSITYAIAIGISCVVGTIFTPLVSGELAALLAKTGTPGCSRALVWLQLAFWFPVLRVG